jgi:hypothetical protein
LFILSFWSQQVSSWRLSAVCSEGVAASRWDGFAHLVQPCNCSILWHYRSAGSAVQVSDGVVAKMMQHNAMSPICRHFGVLLNANRLLNRAPFVACLKCCYLFTMLQ